MCEKSRQICQEYISKSKVFLGFPNRYDDPTGGGLPLMCNLIVLALIHHPYQLGDIQDDGFRILQHAKDLEEPLSAAMFA